MAPPWLKKAQGRTHAQQEVPRSHLGTHQSKTGIEVYKRGRGQILPSIIQTNTF